MLTTPRAHSAISARRRPRCSLMRATEAPGAGQKSESSGLLAQRADYFLRHVAYLDAAVQEGMNHCRRPRARLSRWRNGRTSRLPRRRSSKWACALPPAAMRLPRWCASARTSPPSGASATRRCLRRFRSRKASRIPPRSTPCAERLPRPRRKLAANAARLEKEFPEYAALANPKPLKAEELQQLLGA